MNKIDEIALRVADKLNVAKHEGKSFPMRDSVIDAYAIKFSHALLAELSKDAEPVFQLKMSDGSWIDQAELSFQYNAKNGHVIRKLYEHPAMPDQSEIDSLRKDAERLNWLLDHPDATVCSDGSYGPVHIWFRYSNRLAGYGSKTAREAIDAAMLESKK